jgi:hypothetical protein
VSREYVVFLAPMVFLFGWISHWRRREWLTVVAVLGLVLVVEVLAMLCLFDDPLARFHALAGFAELGASGASELLTAYGEGATRWTVLVRAPSTFAEFSVGKLLVVSVPVVLMLVVVDAKRRGLWSLPIVWFLSLWLPMILLAGIVDPSAPRIRDNHVRYWFLIVPMLYLALFSAGSVVLRKIPGRGVRIVASSLALSVVVGAGFLGLSSIESRTQFRAFEATQWYDVREWLHRNAKDIEVINIDGRMARVIPRGLRRTDLGW